MLTNNYIIINRKPQPFDSFDIGAIAGQSIYAALYCDEVRNVTLVTTNCDVITILWKNEEDYRKGLKDIESAVTVPMSVQNIKLNRYAEEIAKKLSIGVELKVVDAAESQEMVECPECGAMNPKGSPYCMDCGADL